MVTSSWFDSGYIYARLNLNLYIVAGQKKKRMLLIKGEIMISVNGLWWAHNVNVLSLLISSQS